MKYILCNLTFILSFSLFSQMDPFFYGIYTDEQFSISYTVYPGEENEAACFLVDMDKFDVSDEVYTETGIGRCNGETGEIEFSFESIEEPLKIEFDVNDYGLKTLVIHYKSGESVYLTEELDDESTEEFYFSRDDGAELLIYEEEGNIAFTIYGLIEGKCESNELTGVLLPASEDLSVFEYQVNDQCKVEFLIIGEEITIKENGCSGMHASGCGIWDGLYILNK